MRAPELWKRVLSELSVIIDDTTLAKKWLNQTEGKTIEQNLLRVQTPHFYVKDLITRKYRAQIEEILEKLTQEKIRVEVGVEKTRLEEKIRGPLFDQMPPASLASAANRPLADIKPLSSWGLNPTFTFENFVVGPSNRIAHAAALAITESPGQIYNPLFIYGGTGVGKTHLLQAVGNELNRKDSNLRIKYFAAEKFVNGLIDALRFQKDPREFRSSYRLLDVALVDDVQFLGGKESSQEEFFYTFNELKDAGKQVVLVADKHPKEILNLAERLVSRFVGGLLLQIGLPDYETRMAIIQTKAQVLGINLDNETVDFLAENVNDNVREIEGVLQKIKSLMTLENQSINRKTVANLFQEQNIQKARERKVTAEEIINRVSQNFNVTMKDLCGKNRKKEIVLPRQVLMYLLRSELRMGLAEVGQILGGRDHSTVIHGIEKVESDLKKGDVFIKTTVRELHSALFYP